MAACYDVPMAEASDNSSLSNRLGYLQQRRLVPSWSTLERAGNSRVLRTSYFWFLFVPIVARALGFVEHLRIPLLAQFVQSFSLPFSWQMFYFSAAALAAASFIFAMRCPDIVKDYRSFPQYVADGKTIRQSLQTLVDLLFSEDPTQAEQQIHDFLTSFYEFDPPKQIVVWQLLNAKFREGDAPDIFWHVRSYAATVRPMSRAASSLLYVIGFALAAVVLAQSFWSVIIRSALRDILHL